jgi:hypothetical protein
VLRVEADGWRVPANPRAASAATGAFSLEFKEK